ncbi:PREDICTED: uncharacterized protein LOC104798705 isoform X2 [Tarenaya hassleriana]|uniref:uncharacterized protein LOC104798705 isoform X2 n=1 Tax=Tarenaya hassleriana TaxID=28532 RepID=UPI00053C2884|nr:PREDICTED: uncharacterized protein LOC104798705 isoform X2 [Tarenaya hassleriana]
MSGICPPFNVGEIVETRSFEKGYRGAWFRCKIRDIFKKRNEVFYKLEYLDFPDENMHTEKLYQKGVVGDKKHLMLRPQFPHVCHQNEVCDVKGIIKPTLVVNDTFQVGDLVDWWKDDCYWSGTIAEVMGDREVKVELFPLPIGEGSCYVAPCKDVRPSLDWSPVDGWLVPSSKDGEDRRCARLILPADECKVIEGVVRREHIGGARKKLKVDESLPLNIMVSNAIDAAVLDLEELVSRIKWMKSILSSNLEKSSCSTSAWVFQEYCPSSTR